MPWPVEDTHGITLPSRYQICHVDMTMLDWVKAMGIEGFMLRRGALWRELLPRPKAAAALAAFDALDGHYAHSVASGMSFCIVDTRYAFQRREAARAGGALYWHELDGGSAADFERAGPARMRAGMDFPVVSLALACDDFAQRPAEATRQLLALMPLQAQLGAFLANLDVRVPASGYGQVLARSGCVTRPGYEGRGLATALNAFVMLEARARGYLGLTVGMGSPSLYGAYMGSPPPGCSSSVYAHWNFEDIELQDADGKWLHPYKNSGLRDGWMVWVDFHE